MPKGKRESEEYMYAVRFKDTLGKHKQILNELLQEKEFEDIDVGGFTSILPAFMDLSEFGDKEKNRTILRKLSTKQGRAEIISSSLQNLLDIRLSDLATSTEGSNLMFVLTQQWQTYMLAQNLDWAGTNDIANEGIAELFNKNKGLFRFAGEFMDSAEAMLLDEFADGIFDGMTDEEVNSYIKEHPEKNAKVLSDLHTYNQRKSRYGNFTTALNGMGMENKSIGDFINCNFKSEDGSSLSGAEAFEAMCKGKILTVEEKPQKEKDDLAQLLRYPTKDKSLLDERDQRIEAEREVRTKRQKRAKVILEKVAKQQRILKELKQTHNKANVKTEFRRVGCYFIDPADAQEAKEKNEEIMRLMYDPDGQVELLKRTLRSIFDLDIKKLCSTDPDEILDFAEENWDTLSLAFDPSFISSFSGLDPKLDSMMTNCMLLIQECGNVTNIVKGMFLDEYVERVCDGMNITDITQQYSRKEQYREILEPPNVSRYSYLCGLGNLTERQTSYVNFDERLEQAGFKGTTLLDFVKTEFVADNNVKLTTGRAFQNIIDKVGTVSGTEKSPEEKDEIDKMLLRPAKKIILKGKDNNVVNAEDLVNEQRKKINTLPQATSLADYKTLLSVVLKKLPPAIKNDQVFKDAMEPLGDLTKFTGSKKDLDNLTQTWNLLNDYADSIEEKNFADDTDITLDKQIAQIRSIMTMLDNMELVAKQKAPAVLKKDEKSSKKEKKYPFEHREALRIKEKMSKNLKIANDLLSEEEFKNIDIGGFASVLPALMKVEDDEDTMEQNRNILRKLSTQEGRAEYISNLMKTLFEVRLTDLGDTTKSNNLLFLSNNWPTCMLAWNLDWANTSDLISNEAYKLFKDNQELFQCYGDCFDGITGMTLDEFTDGTIDNMTNEDLEIYVNNRPGKNLEDLLKLRTYNQRNLTYAKFNRTLEKMGLDKKSIKDFLSFNFKSDDGKVLSSAEAFKAISQGKILSYEQKPQKEKEDLDDLLNHPTQDKELLKARDQRIEKELKIRTERQKRAKALYNRKFKQREILHQLEKEYQNDPKNKDNHYTKKEFARINYLMIDTSDTEEAKVKNKRTVELLHTPEGQIELYSNILTSIFNLDIRKMSSADPDTILDFAEENWDTLLFAFDPHFATQFSGAKPEVLKMISDCDLLIQEGGFVVNMIEAMSLDEYLDGSMDDISPSELVQKYAARESSLEILDPVNGQKRFSLMQGFGIITNRQKLNQNFEERLERTGFNGTTLLDFAKTKFVGDNGKELTPAKAYQNLIDRVGTVNGIEKSLEEKTKLDELLAKPATKFVLKNGLDASEAVQKQRVEINKLAPAKNLADYKMLLPQVLKKLPNEIANDKTFKSAIKPLGDLKNFMGSEKDLQNLSKTWDLLDKYADGLEQKMFDDPDLELDEQVAQVRSIMTMLDNMEIEAKQAAAASERNAAPAVTTVLKKDAGIEAARNLMIASTKFLKYVDKDLEHDAFKHELASIIVCDKYIKECEKAGKTTTKEEFMGGYNAAVDKLASFPMMERLINNPNVNAAIMQLNAVNSKEDPELFNDVVRVLGEVVVQSANEIQNGARAKQPEPKMPAQKANPNKTV